MRGIITFVLLAASQLTLAPYATAADSTGAFALDGVGGATCKTFIESQKSEDKRASHLFAGWVDGYFSANNKNRPNTFDVTPWQDTELVLALVGRYCETYPNDRFESAAASLLALLLPQRLSVLTSLNMAGPEGKGVPVYLDVLKRVQENLRAQGFYRGPVDGVYNDKLSQALSAYQEKNNFKVTGLPNQETLFRLLPLGGDKAPDKAPVNGAK